MSVSVQLAQVAEQVHSEETVVPPKTLMLLEGIYPIQLNQIKGFSPLAETRICPELARTSSLTTISLIPILFNSPALASIFIIANPAQNMCSDFLFSRRYLPIDLKKPVQEPAIVFKDINATEWEASLHYSKSEIEVLTGRFLTEFRIDANSKNKAWLLDTVSNIVSLYESQYGVELSKEQRKALRNLALRMAYDRLRTE
jgi:hypothetical protein